MISARFVCVAWLLFAVAAPAQGVGTKPANKPSTKSLLALPAPVQPSEAVQRFLGVFSLPDGGAFEVRADAAGSGIMLLGIEVASSVLLTTGKPPTDEEREMLNAAAMRVQQALAPFVTLRGEIDGAQFHGRDAQNAVGKSIESLRPQFGTTAQVVYAGSDLGARTTWAYLRGANGSVAVAVQWSASGKVAGVVACKAEPPTRLPFAVPRGDWAVGAIAKRPTTISVEGKGAGRVLVIEHAGALFVCPWKGDLR